jgi:hypothetical protein
MSAQLEILAPSEVSRLAELEAVVDKGVQTFIEVGEALGEIRDKRLYRQTHVRFDDYMRERWAMSGRQGYRLIEAAGVAELVSTVGPTDETRPIRHTGELGHEPEPASANGHHSGAEVELPLPRNEHVARRLRQTAKKSPERATEIWGPRSNGTAPAPPPNRSRK